MNNTAADQRAVRLERDFLGELELPSEALYGIQTLRATENFQISGIPLRQFPEFVSALGMVKQAAARANARLGLLSDELAGAIEVACQEVIDRKLDDQFVVDMIQGGAGTSTNMNVNEVVANRALQILGRKPGEYIYCHPNDHVNLSQSTNDVYPTAFRIAALSATKGLVGALADLRCELTVKATEFADVLKIGRTQLQDAVPMTLGQEFAAFAVTTGEDVHRLEDAACLLHEVNLGGTAIGTGINAAPHYRYLALEELRKISGFEVLGSADLVEATPDTGAFVMFSGVLKRVAVKLSKMCNDLRLLSSGPRCGFGEINLPPLQSGSSIMPGKVNPVIPEVVNQVAYQVIGNDLTITMAAEAGQLQLNAMQPVLVLNLLQSVDVLSSAVRTLTRLCVTGISVNRDRCAEFVANSVTIATALVPQLGYDRASSVARTALSTGRSIPEVLLSEGFLDAGQIATLLSPESMIGLYDR